MRDLLPVFGVAMLATCLHACSQNQPVKNETDRNIIEADVRLQPTPKQNMTNEQKEALKLQPKKEQP